MGVQVGFRLQSGNSHRQPVLRSHVQSAGQLLSARRRPQARHSVVTRQRLRHQDDDRYAAMSGRQSHANRPVLVGYNDRADSCPGFSMTESSRCGEQHKQSHLARRGHPGWMRPNAAVDASPQGVQTSGTSHVVGKAIEPPADFLARLAAPPGPCASL